jgi:Domain of unknown function (DUF4276)
VTNGFRRLHVLVEGQTEEIVLRDVLQPYLEGRGWCVSHSLIATKRVNCGPDHRGGITNWRQVEGDVQRLLRDTSLDVLTTLFDYYAFPADSPGMSTLPSGDPYTKVAHVEQALAAHFGDPRFRPNLVLHELEAWVFAAAKQLGELLGDEVEAKLREDVARAGNPELVNDHPQTAPSKRLQRYCPGYTKTLEGPMAIEALGIDALRECCQHLDAWLRSLE